ncbi:MAG TPA: Rne/Rng family ribonuclease [Beutenbergiaceae bacterium]|nr:Rne/Rng family ribonuclease [Beutenbergiaceae bacterium]
MTPAQREAAEQEASEQRAAEQASAESPSTQAQPAPEDGGSADAPAETDAGAAAVPSSDGTDPAETPVEPAAAGKAADGDDEADDDAAGEDEVAADDATSDDDETDERADDAAGDDDATDEPALDVFAALGVDPKKTPSETGADKPAVIDLDIPERDRKDPRARGTQPVQQVREDEAPEDSKPERGRRGKSRSRRSPVGEHEEARQDGPGQQGSGQADHERGDTAGHQRDGTDRADAEGHDGEDKDHDRGADAEQDTDSPRLPATALLFQAPDPTRARRPRRAAAPAGPPAVDTPSDEPGDRQAERDQRGETRPDTEAAAEDSSSDSEAAEPPASDDGESGQGPKRRRRRRGGRGRRRGNGKRNDQGEDSEDAAKSDGSDRDRNGDQPASNADDEDSRKTSSSDRGSEQTDSGDNGDNGSGSGSSRRRRRRRGSRGSGSEDGGRDEVTALKGSTRLEAKRQRRRDGRDSQRRRAIITEAEFLARRESVKRDMVVRERNGRTQVAVLEDEILVEHYVARKTQTSMVGNVYLGRVQNVLPSMEAAFIDIGKGRNAVLYAGEVNWDAAGLEGQPRRIEQALAPGDTVLVQVTKDPAGHKGARLTSQITLAGRYLVLVPSGAMTGISRKLPDTERNRLKKLLKDIVPDGQGVIVRTAAEGATEEELRRDVERLTRQWADIQKKSNRKSVNAPTLLKGEPELAVRVVRDVFNEDFSSLTISGDEAWKTVSEYVEAVAPDLRDRVYHWTDKKDLFAELRINEQIAKALDRKVWLPSGGSLVIDRTEAMTVVDVNTGKFTGTGGTLEETVTRNNLEAAEEIVRQLRLRDIGGIIVIDFIDMVLEANRDLVLRRLVECLGRDRTRHQVAEVTSLGLVQMTRKRIGQGLLEAFSESCEHCNGRGYHVHTEPLESDDRGKRGNKSKGGGRAEPEQDEAQRAQVRAALANIAAAAANAHAEQDAKDAQDAQKAKSDSDEAEEKSGAGEEETRSERSGADEDRTSGKAGESDAAPADASGTSAEATSNSAEVTSNSATAAGSLDDASSSAAERAAESAAQSDGTEVRRDDRQDGDSAAGEPAEPTASATPAAQSDESQAEPGPGDTAPVGTAQE